MVEPPRRERPPLGQKLGCKLCSVEFHRHITGDDVSRTTKVTTYIPMVFKGIVAII
jgi:hypothetical protein